MARVKSRHCVSEVSPTWSASAEVSVGYPMLQGTEALQSDHRVRSIGYDRCGCSPRTIRPTRALSSLRDLLFLLDDLHAGGCSVITLRRQAALNRCRDVALNSL